MNRIKTSQIRDFFSIVNAFIDYGVIIKFMPDMSKIMVVASPYTFIEDFNLNYFDYNSLCLLIDKKIASLNGGVSIEDLMSKFKDI